MICLRCCDNVVEEVPREETQAVLAEGVIMLVEFLMPSWSNGVGLDEREHHLRMADGVSVAGDVDGRTPLRRPLASLVAPRRSGRMAEGG